MTKQLKEKHIRRVANAILSNLEEPQWTSLYTCISFKQFFIVVIWHNKILFYIARISYMYVCREQHNSTERIHIVHVRMYAENNTTTLNIYMYAYTNSFTCTSRWTGSTLPNNLYMVQCTCICQNHNLFCEIVTVFHFDNCTTLLWAGIILFHFVYLSKDAAYVLNYGIKHLL